MLIVGEQTVFLSHLPLFHSPHNYQVILEATFAKPGSDPQADYFNDRKRTGTKIYTLEPEPFVLPRLAAAEPRRSFKASIYREHFERFPNQRAKEAARIGQNVDVNVTRVVLLSQIRSRRRDIGSTGIFSLWERRRTLPCPLDHQTAGLRSNPVGQGAQWQVHRRGVESRSADCVSRQNQFNIQADSGFRQRDGTNQSGCRSGAEYSTIAIRR